MNNRDNFTQSTIDKLGKQVSYLCSNPDCRILTTSARRTSINEITNLGVAAHICAAAPNGPRYNSTMTPEQRKSENNGIWLCQTCSRLIDREPNNYSVQLLHEWKRQASEYARSMLGQQPFPRINPLYRKPPEQIYRENDIEFLQNYLNFAPFTQINHFIKMLPHSVHTDLFVIGKMWTLARDDMPHLCNLKDVELDEYLRNFFIEYKRLSDLIHGYLPIQTKFGELWLDHFVAPDIFRGVLYLNHELPFDYRNNLVKDIQNKVDYFYAEYKKLINFLRDKYPELVLEGQQA